MTLTDFNSQIDRLTERFNAGRVYNNEFRKMLFKGVSGLAQKDFEKIVNNFIGNSRHSPLLKDFLESANSIYSGISATNQKELSARIEAQPSCPYCERGGLISGVKRQGQGELSGYPKTFACGLCRVSKINGEQNLESIGSNELDWFEKTYLPDWVCAKNPTLYVAELEKIQRNC